MRQNKSLFKWRHFEPTIILLCVRWYCRYQLSYRDLEEMMSERGLPVDHTTISGCLINLGQCYIALGNTKESVEVILRASTIYTHLAQKNPEAFEADLARSLRFMASCYQQLRLLPDALKASLRAALIYESLAAKTPTTFEPNMPMGITGKGGKYYELIASGAQLTSLPEDVGKLTHLRHLDLSNNQLTTLPKALSNLSELQHLDLSANSLTAAPEVVFMLPQLQHLNVAGNKLSSIPKAITGLEQLQSLNLSDTGLRSAPSFLGQLANLRALDLSNNELASLPESIGHLANLKSLEASGNNLRSLPESLGQLNQLRVLYLVDNRLAELPEPVSRLTRLQELNLSDNELAKLPESLSNLKQLKGLYLHGNDALGLPAEVLGPKWNTLSAPARPVDILEYYFRARGGVRRPLNEAKLILVGRGAVGKTSILNRLIHRTFKEVEKKTEGVRITEWPLALRGKEDVRLNVWDFGGQEIMHATHQFFLTERSLYLLVLNGRGGGEDAEAEYWLKLIQSFGGDSPVIVILNKIKSYPFDVNRSALQQKYPFVRDFVRTDCKTGTGIAELRRLVERETDSLEHLRDAFPAAWFSIKDRLAGMKKNFLSFDEFRQECARLGEGDSQAQELLASYLHSLGIVLNYKDDARLRDTHILNPNWVTNGIYKILNADRLEKQKGVIRLRDLAHILAKRDYPARMHRFLLDLMKKFELCFSFPGEETHYLIPELLDKQEPEEARAFNPEECLNFQYHYPVLPEGLLPRFIVRTHVLSDDTPRWRTGVVLKLEDNLALVKADAQDRRVFVNVKGPVAGRRRLLSIIRANFDRIHGDIRRLQPVEIVPLPGHPGAVVPYDELLAWEKSGIKKFPKVVDGSVVELDVSALLSGVELEAERKRARAADERRRAARVFISYSHKDERLFNELVTHLSPLRRLRLIETLDGREIEASDDWRVTINENLNRADLIILLISPNFITSDYCYEKEAARAIERHENGEARVIPVIVREANWKLIPRLARLQVMPKDGKAITSWSSKDKAWLDVSERIQQMLEGMRASDLPGRRAH